MSTELQAFGAFLREQADSRLHELAANITKAGPTYASDPNITNKIRASYIVLAESIERENRAELIEMSKVIGADRARSGFSIQEVLASTEILRDHIWNMLEEFMEYGTPWDAAQIRAFEDFIHTFQLNISAEFGKVLEQTREELHDKSEQLDAQRRTIRELGTPILPVHEGVLVMPLVGIIDSNRATQVMETLLEAISAHQADIVILDITGVPLVDTSVANYILQAARATRLIGARVVLVGIGAEIAQTMVHLGVDLSDIMTLANLQEGLQYAFEQHGLGAMVQ
jgi:rsbT co-antagonist protein RsbR